MKSFGLWYLRLAIMQYHGADMRYLRAVMQYHRATMRYLREVMQYHRATMKCAGYDTGAPSDIQSIMLSYALVQGIKY